MLILVLIVFAALVLTIALITAKLNAKAPCDHDWQEMDGDLRCFKCYRVIPGGRRVSGSTEGTDAVEESDEMGRFA